jgi:hypothetical protein
MRTSEQLKRLWPEYFGDPDTEELLINKCYDVLNEIEGRYSQQCRTAITRRQITEIQNLLRQIEYFTNLKQTNNP